MNIRPLGNWKPEIAEGVFVAPSADVLGQVVIGPRASIWYNVTLRGDLEPILIGELSNVQDGSVVHTDHDLPTVIGKGVTVGHQACVHGATVGDYSLIGIGATLLSGAKIGAGSIVAAGSLIPEGKEVPPGVLAMGAPFKIKRDLTEEEKAGLKVHAEHYAEYAAQHVAWLGLHGKGEGAGNL
jgi:carbonic anhydrase/acetyltransferase-like protein (isoleucine patch superfamily)